MIFNIYSLDDDNNKNLEARFDSSSLKIETSNGELEFILNKKIKFCNDNFKTDKEKLSYIYNSFNNGYFYIEIV